MVCGQGKTHEERLANLREAIALVLRRWKQSRPMRSRLGQYDGLKGREGAGLIDSLEVVGAPAGAGETVN